MTSATAPRPTDPPATGRPTERAGRPEVRWTGAAATASRDERREQGRAARRRVPRGTLGHWERGGDRPDPLATILAQNASRATDLVPVRHGRMTASPWTYYRGAAAVMAADLASAPHTGLEVQLCGDAHVLNFGLWATPERNLSFDLRDFDETLAGPFEWDVLRLAASLVVVARENGLPPGTGDDAVRAALASYRGRMAHHAASHELDVWYEQIHVDRLLEFFEPEDRERIGAHIDKRARRRTSRGASAKLTTVEDGRRTIRDDPPWRVHLDQHQADLAEAVFEAYRASVPEHVRHLLDRFTVVDAVRQVVGVGSVGMRVFLLLLDGRGGDDPLFLQVKQAGPSVYEQHLAPSPHANAGARVVAGKRLIQSATDLFVGWTTAAGRDFYVRQFRDMKVIPDSERIAPHLVGFAAACGKVLARAHARTGDPVAISAYIGKGARFDEAVGRFARDYADQNERDHAELAEAVASGRVPAAEGW